MKGSLNHERLLALSKELRRPLYTLEVLRNDPFTAGVPARKAGAQWFAKLWRRLGIEPGTHLRRIHYVLVSQDPPVRMLDGGAYINTRNCAAVLERTSLDARYLGLVPSSSLVDRRNDEPVIYLPDNEYLGSISAVGGQLDYKPPHFDVPSLCLLPPTILQPFHIEIWCEKSTMNDVLRPLGQRYGVNVITGAGELSLTHCVALVARAEESERPVRILYLSDFDPAGASMPVAVARKIEFEIRNKMLDLDVQVRPIVLTHDQCRQYRLPRIPIKETETRAATFEARYGEGATELDALEALHPGELARILTREIQRYRDAGLDRRVASVAGNVQMELNDINAAVRKKHAKAITALEAERKALAAAVEAFEKQAKPVLRKIEKDLEAEAPDIEGYDWPEPEEGDEDDDPLFDSTRDYLDQVDRYKDHQGKPTESTRKPYDFFPATCTCCGEPFEATRRAVVMVCSPACREKLRRQKAAPAPIPCVVCGKPFKSIRGAETCSDGCRKKLRRRRGRADE